MKCNWTVGAVSQDWIVEGVASSSHAGRAPISGAPNQTPGGQVTAREAYASTERDEPFATRSGS